MKQARHQPKPRIPFVSSLTWTTHPTSHPPQRAQAHGGGVARGAGPAPPVPGLRGGGGGGRASCRRRSSRRGGRGGGRASNAHDALARVSPGRIHAVGAVAGAAGAPGHHHHPAHDATSTTSTRRRGAAGGRPRLPNGPPRLDPAAARPPGAAVWPRGGRAHAPAGGAGGCTGAAAAGASGRRGGARGALPRPPRTPRGARRVRGWMEGWVESKNTGNTHSAAATLSSSSIPRYASTDPSPARPPRSSAWRRQQHTEEARPSSSR